jgi:hypothetical protein
LPRRGRDVALASKRLMADMTLQQEQLIDDLRRDRKVREALRALTAGARQIGAVRGFLFGAVIASTTTMLVLR